MRTPSADWQERIDWGGRVGAMPGNGRPARVRAICVFRNGTLHGAAWSRRHRPPILPGMTTSPTNRALQGKNALVTGAASGIGRAIAARFVSEGASVIAVDRDAEALRTVSDETGATPLVID